MSAPIQANRRDSRRAAVRGSTAQILAGVRLFVGLDQRALEEAASMAAAVEHERNTPFFCQGDRARRFYVLSRGRVKVTQITPEGHEVVVRYAGAGNIFGCVPLYGGKDYPATATAATRCEALTWDRPTMDRLMERYPRIAINALEMLGAELAEIRSRYQELATQRVEQRIARALLRLIAHEGKRIDPAAPVELPLSRHDLAGLTGTTLHTVSRILSAWEHQGIMGSGRGRVVIRKPAALAAIAEDLKT